MEGNPNFLIKKVFSVCSDSIILTYLYNCV